jgi:predicted nucleic acid-binding protein
MKVLIDTNVLLDVAQKREPFFSASDRVVRWCEDHPGSGFLAWHTVSNLYYVLRKSAGESFARAFIATTLDHLEVAPTGTPEAKHALHLGIGDYEDALQVSVALAAGADVIITRDAADFVGSIIVVRTPEDFLVRAPL